MAHPYMCRISFTYAPVASMWVVALHSLFLYSDLPVPCHPLSSWLRLFLSQTFSRLNTPTFSTPAILHTYPPMKCRQIKFRHRGITQKKAYNNLLYVNFSIIRFYEKLLSSSHVECTNRAVWYMFHRNVNTTKWSMCEMKTWVGR